MPAPGAELAQANQDAADAVSAGDSQTKKRMVHHDDSPLCLAPKGSFDELRADQTVMWVRNTLRSAKGSKPLELGAERQLDVVFEGHCLSTCEGQAEHVCSVELVGRELRVSSTLSYERIGRVCTEAGGLRDCHPAVCSTPALPAGSYTLVYGEAELPFTVPGALERRCLWSGKPRPER